MGSMPPQLLKYATDGNVADATNQFNHAMTQIAHDFHAQLARDIGPADIKLHAPRLFGRNVKLDYVASGSVGSVYKMQIGDDVFAFKINRKSAFGEMTVMPMQSRVRNLVNKMHIGNVFEYNGRKYSWVLSDYIERDSADSFYRAMQKLYWAYLTKGIDITDAHSNNFKDGKLIDTASLTSRKGKIDDVKKLTRPEIDMVKRLAYYIKTDKVPEFENLITRVARTNPAVLNYMFFAMKFGKSAIFGVGKTDAFSVNLRKFEKIVDVARRNAVLENRARAERE